MTSKFTELAIDCADPNGLARFWCSVLDYEVQDEDDGIVTIGSPMVPEGKNHLGPVPPTLTFAHVPEGKTVKNRLRLDVNPTDRDQDESEAAHWTGATWQLLQGNEFRRNHGQSHRIHHHVGRRFRHRTR